MRKRARQNVIFELGYFLAALKRGKVCALMAGNIEVPSDFAGVVYIQKDEGEAWHHQMAKEMRAAGLRVNSDRL